LLLCTHSAGPVSQTCFLWSKRQELLCTVVTLDDSTQQRRISELRVWSYEPFIVFAQSSSGYTSGQNLEVLYIIRNSIWNIFKIIQRIIEKHEIVLETKIGHCFILRRIKNKRWLASRIKNKSLLALRKIE